MINDTERILKRLTSMIEACSTENSNIYKKQIIANYPELREILEFIYNPFKKFHVTAERLLDSENEFSASTIIYNNIYLLLEALSNRTLTGEKAVNACTLFIDMNSKYCDTLLKIFDKDLKCGINVKTINAVFKDLIPEFNVPLANSYKEGSCDFENEEWFMSRKLDGVRCLCFITEKGVSFYSRKGHEFHTLDKLCNDIAINYKGSMGVILDGEVCITDKNGNENFNKVMREIRKKNHTIDKPKFFVFDQYYIKDFINKNKSFYGEMFKSANYTLNNCTFVEVVKQSKVDSLQHLESVMNELPITWEGLILKKYPTYFKRSNNLLKIKKFKEAEYTVVGITPAIKRIDDVHQKCVGSLIITHKNYPVKIGSGLSDKQRVQWWENNQLILGKKITVQYFEESEDKIGRLSLRMATFKGVRDYD